MKFIIRWLGYLGAFSLAMECMALSASEPHYGLVGMALLWLTMMRILVEADE